MLDTGRLAGDNGNMEIQGVVQNGVVVVDGKISLPEERS